MATDDNALAAFDAVIAGKPPAGNPALAAFDRVAAAPTASAAPASDARTQIAVRKAKPPANRFGDPNAPKSGASEDLGMAEAIKAGAEGLGIDTGEGQRPTVGQAILDKLPDIIGGPVGGMVYNVAAGIPGAAKGLEAPVKAVVGQNRPATKQERKEQLRQAAGTVALLTGGLGGADAAKAAAKAKVEPVTHPPAVAGDPAIEAFGPEGAARYRALEKIVDNAGSDPDAARAAMDEGGKMESSLSPEKLAKLHSAEPPPAPEAKPFNADEYVKEQIAKREAAREKQTVGEKAVSFLKDAKSKLVDFTSPIEDTLSKATRESGTELKPSEDIHNQIDRVLRAPSIAGQFAKDYGLDTVIRDVPDLDKLDQYLIARRTQDLAAREQPIETGRDVGKDSELVKALGPEYEPFAQKIDGYTAALRKYWVDSGLGSEEQVASMVEKDPHWVPFQRVFGEAEDLGGGSGGSGVASLSKQTFVRPIKGSTRPAENPLASLLTSTSDLVRQGEKNKAAAMLVSYKDLPGNPFGLSPLRTAENVARRGEILGELHDLGIESRANRRQVRTLGRQMKATDAKLSSRILEVQSRIDATQAESNATWEEAKTRAGDLADSPEIEKILGRGLTRERRIHSLQGRLTELENSKAANRFDQMRETADQLKDLVSERTVDVKALQEELGAIRDVPKSATTQTISFLNHGVTETWAADPDIVRAAKALDVQQLGLIGKILAAPVRLAKAGITGLNLPFLLSNVARDQMTGIINSDHVLSTSIANPRNFVRALFEAIHHGDVLAEMAREGAHGTSFDMARDAARQTVESVRSERSFGSRAKYVVRHPSEMFRAVEDILARGEELTRIQHYTGTKEALLKEGMPEPEARIAAARASRENTVNFARRGQWGRVINAMMLYMNADIQGQRTLLRNLKTRPIATAAKVAATIYFPVAVVTAWNLMDPKRRAAYGDIAEYEKQNNMIFVPPNPTQDAKGRWNVIKVPLPQEINNSTSLPRKALEQVMKFDSVKAGDVFDAIVGTFLPSTSMGGLMSNATPQIVRPSLEVGTNKNFFTRGDIVPDRVRRRPPEFQVMPNTSGTARAIAKPLGVSPMKVEHFVRATAGGVGSQVLNVADRAAAAAGLIPKEQIGGEDPIEAVWRRFGKAAGGERARRARQKRGF